MRGWKMTVLKHVAFMSAVMLPFLTQQPLIMMIRPTYWVL